jgi:hypothetical protein
VASAYTPWAVMAWRGGGVAAAACGPGGGRACVARVVTSPITQRQL